jgi:hypothetical protein
MNLQEFVSSSLQQIAAGVAEAQSRDGRIAPLLGISEDDPKILRTLHGTSVSRVKFSVPITYHAPPKA